MIVLLRKENISKGLFKPYIANIEVEGLNFDFLISSQYAQQWYGERKSAEHFELAFVRDYILKKGDVVFDVGAQHGFHSIPYSKWIGEEGQVFSFEAHPENVHVIEKNIELNIIKNIDVYNKAVGSSSKNIYIKNFVNSHIVAFWEKNKIKVRMDPLDSYINLKPNFIKIDVEGYEAEVLRGAKEILKTQPKLSIEIHTNTLKRYSSSVYDVLNLLELSRYQCWIQWQRGAKPEPYDMKRSINEHVNFFAIPESRT